jgi:predicted transcriptional regulator
MTPEDYRAKWKLPSDYPMTAPNYAARRSSLAKSFGLGQRKSKNPARKTRARK